MPPRSHRNQGNQRNQANQPATVEQIARLHALLRKAEEEARRVNFPLSVALESNSIRLFWYYMLSEANKASLEALVSDYFPTETYQILGLLTLAMTVMGVFYYQWFRLAQYTVEKLFPNGFPFNQNRDPAYELKHQFITQKEANDAITRLETLIEKQKSSASFYSWLNILVQIILPLTASFRVWQERMSDGRVHANFQFVPPTITLVTTTLGLAWDVTARLGEPIFSVPKFVRSTLLDLQSLSYIRWFGHKWSNWNLPKQLKTEQNYLNTMSLLLGSNAIQWKVVQGEHQKSRETAMFTLDVSHVDSVTVMNAQGKTLQVPKRDYLVELHRVLLEAGLPVYANSDEKLIVGFHGLWAYQSRKSATTLLQRLEAIVDQQADIAINLKLLNKIGIQKNLSDLWHSYTDISQKNWFNYILFGSDNRTTQYYLNIMDVPENLREAYKEALNQLIPSSQQRWDGDILRVQGVLTEPQDWSDILTTFREFRPIQQATPVTYYPQEPSTPSRLRTSKASTPVPEKEVTEKPKSPYPDKIKFAGNVRFYRENSAWEKARKHPKQRAFPIHVPFIKEGRAYAVVDPKVLDSLPQGLTEKQIRDQLESGAVHGHSQGGNGIQIVGQNKNICPPPYTDVHGQSHTSAKLKLKFANNWGIFGDSAERVKVDGEECVLYRFDGAPSLRH